MARAKKRENADSYYLVIRGKKYDRRMIELADGLTQGRGDGRISIDDAKNLLSAVKDSNNYSDIEKQTMAYIRKHYKFTKEGDEFFRSEIRKWAAGKRTKKAATSGKAAEPDARAVTPVAPPPQPLPAVDNSTSPPKKNASAWKGILLALLLLIGLAALIYFVFYRSSCAVRKQATAPQTTEAPPAAVPTAAADRSASGISGELRAFVGAQKLAFKLGKAELTADSAAVLDALAERLKKENARIRITGHSCALGTKSINQKISEKRAQVVKDALVNRGVPAERIETRGAADSEPIGNNRTVESRVASRRVTFSVIE